MTPETRYVRSRGAHIAYQVVGEGPVDLVVFGALASHVELIWEDPGAARFLRRLAGFSRLIHYDKLGVGMSDPIPGNDTTFEQRLDDCRAVLDAVGSENAVFLGISEGSPLAALMASTDPGRVRGIVMFSGYARLLRAPDYPRGLPGEVLERFLDELDETWDSERLLSIVMPSVMADPARRRFWNSYLRRSITPGQFRLQAEQNAVADISAALPLVQAPALVMHGTDDRWIPIQHARYVAERIPGAVFMELPTGDHLPYAEVGELVANEVQEFVTGTREAAEPERRLATIMFSDIVDSTATASKAGDRRWIELLDSHDQQVRHQLERHRGTEVKHTGDGIMAMFEGPARAIRCGRAIAEAVTPYGLHVRIGVHTGEVEVRSGDVGGIAVHIAARVASLAGADELLVSQSIPPLVVGSGLSFESVGTHPLKGVPGEWTLFRATD